MRGNEEVLFSVVNAGQRLFSGSRNNWMLTLILNKSLKDQFINFSEYSIMAKKMYEGEPYGFSA